MISADFAIVVVGYQFDEETVPPKVAVWAQLAPVFFIDNSSQNSDHLFPSNDIHYIWNSENLGIAEAQNIGAASAYELCPYVLFFDQDSEISNDHILSLVKQAKNLAGIDPNFGLLVSTHFDKDSGEIDRARLNIGALTEHGVYRIPLAMSSGSIVSCRCFRKVGGCGAELFIDLVDFDFCWRATQEGYNLYRTESVMLGHKIGQGKRNIFFGFDCRVPAPFRHYYHTRNTIAMLKRSYVPLSWKFRSALFLAGRFLIYPLFLDDGYRRLNYMARGFIDGFIGKMGRLS